MSTLLPWVTAQIHFAWGVQITANILRNNYLNEVGTCEVLQQMDLAAFLDSCCSSDFIALHFFKFTQSDGNLHQTDSPLLGPDLQNQRKAGRIQLYCLIRLALEQWVEFTTKMKAVIPSYVQCKQYPHLYNLRKTEFYSLNCNG